MFLLLPLRRSRIFTYHSPKIVYWAHRHFSNFSKIDRHKLLMKLVLGPCSNRRIWHNGIASQLFRGRGALICKIPMSIIIRIHVLELSCSILMSSLNQVVVMKEQIKDTSCFHIGTDHFTMTTHLLLLVTLTWLRIIDSSLWKTFDNLDLSLVMSRRDHFVKNIDHLIGNMWECFIWKVVFLVK